MDRVEELELLQLKLINKELNYKEVYDIIKSMPKVWYTKEWKIKRDKLIKNYCEVCGIQSGPFVLQHNEQPVIFTFFYNYIKLELFKNKFPNFEIKLNKKVKIELEKYLKKEFKIREACPDCGTINLRKRINLNPKFICAKGHQFDKTILLKYFATLQTTNEKLVLEKMPKIIFDNLKSKALNEFTKNHDFEIGRLALIFSINESIEYNRLTNTKTSCKKCAFKEDIFYVNLNEIKKMMVK